ncbi:hypothetical protein BHM03_00057783 [Ensete ventricosum]|nr:hypothetical protein BHM03_00057783 [Ensete ventricosum]
MCSSSRLEPCSPANGMRPRAVARRWAVIPRFFGTYAEGAFSGDLLSYLPRDKKVVGHPSLSPRRSGGRAGSSSELTAALVKKIRAAPKGEELQSQERTRRKSPS